MGLFRGIGSRKDATRGTSPIEVRKVLAGLFASVGGIGARSGILYNGSTAALVTGDATWAYNVDIFHAYVSRSASDGGTVFGNDGAVLIGATGVGSTVPIAPGAGLQRIDIAWTRHPTAGENGDGATTVALSSDPLFGVASGVAASSSPVAPTIPAGAFELGRNLMTDAATSTSSVGNTITQSALYTAVRGAPIPVRNQGERDALPLFNGQGADRLDLHRTERYDGTSWVPASGSGSLYTASGTVVANAGATGNLDIVYPVTFTAVVWAVANGGSGASPIVTTESATTTGCQFILRNASGVVVASGTGPYRVNWSATGILA